VSVGWSGNEFGKSCGKEEVKTGTRQHLARRERERGDRGALISSQLLPLDSMPRGFAKREKKDKEDGENPPFLNKIRGGRKRSRNGTVEG